MKEVPIFTIIFVFSTSLLFAGLQSNIYDQHMPSGLTDDAVVIVTIKKIKRGALNDIGDSAEFYLASRLLPYNIVYEKNGRTTKITEYTEKNLGDSPNLDVSAEYRSNYKVSKSSVVTSGKRLNDLVAKYPNGDFAEFRVHIYEDDLIGDEKLGGLEFTISELKRAAKYNPFGFSKEYSVHDKNSGMHAILELKVKEAVEDDNKSIVNTDRSTRKRKTSSPTRRQEPQPSRVLDDQ